MDIKPLLPRNHVLLSLDRNHVSRRALLEALCQPLVQSGIVESLPLFIDAVEAREDQVTTRMGGGIALPHARSTAVKRLGLTVGRAIPDGLPFGVGVPEHCRLFFLIAVPAASPTAHLPLLKHLSQALRSDSQRQRILAAKTASALVRALTVGRR